MSARRPKLEWAGYGGWDRANGANVTRESFHLEKPRGVGDATPVTVRWFVKRWAREKLGSSPVQTDKQLEAGGKNRISTISRALAGPAGSIDRE
jgi:hypothetical protein